MGDQCVASGRKFAPTPRAGSGWQGGRSLPRHDSLPGRHVKIKTATGALDSKTTRREGMFPGRARIRRGDTR